MACQVRSSIKDGPVGTARPVCKTPQSLHDNMFRYLIALAALVVVALCDDAPIRACGGE